MLGKALEFYVTGWLTNKFRESVTFWARVVFYGLDTCGNSAPLAASFVGAL